MNEPNVDRRRAKQRMPPPLQLPGIFGFQKINDARHFVNGVFAEMRTGAVRGFSASLQPKPEAAFVGGHDLQAGRFADDGEVRSKPLAPNAREPAWAFSSSINPAKTISVADGPSSPAGQADQGGEHGGDRTFGIAPAPAINTAVGNRGTNCFSETAFTVSR